MLSQTCAVCLGTLVKVFRHVGAAVNAPSSAGFVITDQLQLTHRCKGSKQSVNSMNKTERTYSVMRHDETGYPVDCPRVDTALRF